MFRVAVITACFTLPLVAAAGRKHDVSGQYSSNYDDVRLVQDGDRIRGSYVCCGGGTIDGRIIEGRTIRYRWKQPDGWGSGVWVIDGNRLKGTWGWKDDDDDGGAWDLARKPASIAQ